MKHYKATNTKGDEHTFHAESNTDARHWVINHLDCSYQWEITELLSSDLKHIGLRVPQDIYDQYRDALIRLKRLGIIRSDKFNPNLIELIREFILINQRK